MEQNLNIKFVNEVEKHPELYNYTLKGYSRKNIIEKAWSEVAAEVKLTGSLSSGRTHSLILVSVSIPGYVSFLIL